MNDEFNQTFNQERMHDLCLEGSLIIKSVAIIILRKTLELKILLLFKR